MSKYTGYVGVVIDNSEQERTRNIPEKCLTCVEWSRNNNVVVCPHPGGCVKDKINNK